MDGNDRYDAMRMPAIRFTTPEADRMTIASNLDAAISGILNARDTVKRAIVIHLNDRYLAGDRAVYISDVAPSLFVTGEGSMACPFCTVHAMKYRRVINGNISASCGDPQCFQCGFEPL